MLTAAITLSMLLTPLLILVADRWWIPFLAKFSPRTKLSEIAEPQDAPVIIAGFGRYGQIIGRLLYANGIKSTVLEHDAEAVESLRKFGFRVHYGDATRLDLLRVAGAARAHVLVVAVDGIEASLELVDIARENFPNLTIVARARNVQHWYQLNERGVRFIERETLDAALMSGRSVLEAMGYEPHRARNAGDALPPPLGAAAARAGAALPRRVQADLAGARRPPAAGAAVRARAARPSAGRANVGHVSRIGAAVRRGRAAAAREGRRERRAAGTLRNPRLASQGWSQVSLSSG